MTDQKLRQVVAEAIALDREIQEKTVTLKELKAGLVAEAESRNEEHVASPGGGSAWTFESPVGDVVRVNWPVPSLKSSVAGEGKAIEKVREAAGRAFNDLFKPAVSYRLVEGFRAEAERILGKACTKLIKLVQSESAPRVSFETKKMD